MNKKLLTLLIVLISCIAVFAFAGCNKDTTPDGDGENYVLKTTIDEQKCIIFTASKDVLNIGYSTSIADYLNALKSKNYLNFESSTGDFGMYITSMDGTANVDNPDFTGYSWMFYIDFLTLEGDDAEYANDFATFAYEGKTLYSSNYGVSGTPCVEGHTYAFVYEHYDYGSWN